MKSSSNLSFYIETLGCAKNVVDSRTMRSDLLRNGFSEQQKPEDADFILINTCSFVKEAKENTIESIFEAIKLKNQSKTIKVGVIGCFTQQFADTLNTELPEADFFLGTQKYHQISNILSKKFDIRLAPLKPGEIVRSVIQQKDLNPYAYFRIAQGCSRKCSFCIIPGIRGPLQSYNLESLEKQYNDELINRKMDNPLREAIFVSQDTISTPIGTIENFINFFTKINEIEWIRLHYLFPDKRMFDILDLMNQFQKVVPYVDIPFQHISPEILNSMSRPDNPELFSDIIKYALNLNPETEFRTSFIIGFPNETEKDIEMIADFLKTNVIHKCSLFRYSHEEGAPASKTLTDNIPEDVKIERMNYLRNVHLESRSDLRRNLIGKKVKLILDDVSDNEIIGRRAQDSPDIDEVVYLTGNKELFKKGDFVQARIDTAMEYDWMGEIIE
jgi:ribosomal protein S12 methylthiotransferase